MDIILHSQVSVILFVFALYCVAETEAASAAPESYSSPAGVFEAFRQATEKQDWRTLFHCHVPEAGDTLVFEAYFGCNMHLNNPKVIAVLKNHGAESKAIEAEYDRLFRANRSDDRGEFGAKQESHRPDKGLLRKAVSARVTDKAGFYDAASKVLANKEEMPRIGRLDELTVHGDTVTGRASTIVYSIHRLPGKTERRAETRKIKRSASVKLNVDG